MDMRYAFAKPLSKCMTY